MSQRKLVVIPSDPIEAYERKGLDWLERYYNPGGHFDAVYALSPLEARDRDAYGMHIRRVERWGLKKALRTIRPDVVRAYGGYWACDFACYNKVGKIPVVVSVHDDRPSLLHPSIVYADMVVCMSKSVAELVRSYRVPDERIRILPNRVDTAIFRPRERGDCLRAFPELPSEGKNILHVGRKDPQKNLTTVVRSLTFLPEEYSAFFVGPGDTGPYRKLAEEMGVAHRCHWLDPVQNSSLPFLYSWADCFCTPSLHEGFGVVFIEAAACGAAIVTSDIAPINEYLTDGESAVLVKEYTDPRHIAEAIRKVCTDDGFRKKITSGAPVAAAPFELETVNRREIGIYEEMMAEEFRPGGKRIGLDSIRHSCRNTRRSIKHSIKKLFTA